VCIPAPAVGEKNKLLFSLGALDPLVPVRLLVTNFSRDIDEPMGATELYIPDFLLSFLSYDESPTVE
jgi:hypothetical protein